MFVCDAYVRLFRRAEGPVYAYRQEAFHNAMLISECVLPQTCVQQAVHLLIRYDAQFAFGSHLFGFLLT